jgi:hypothetical protein
MLFLTFLIYANLVGCGINSFEKANLKPVLNQINVSNSVLVVNSSTIITKAIDENGNSCLVKIYSMDKPDEYHSYHKIELPDEVQDFELLGIWAPNGSTNVIYILSGDQVYAIYSSARKFSYDDSFKKIDEDIDLNETIITEEVEMEDDEITDIYVNGCYKAYLISGHRYNYQIHCDDEGNIIFTDNGIDFQLMQQSPLKNSFTVLDEELCPNIIIIGKDNTVYCYKYQDEAEPLLTATNKFDEEIINYGRLRNGSPLSEYFYIVTNSLIYVYDAKFNLIQEIAHPDNLIGIGGGDTNSQREFNSINLVRLENDKIVMEAKELVKVEREIN